MKEIVAWMNKKEKAHLIKLNEGHGLNFRFVNSFEEFAEGILGDNIPLLPGRRVDSHYGKLVEPMESRPDLYFHSLEGKPK